jgi:hypothetical protein
MNGFGTRAIVLCDSCLVVLLFGPSRSWFWGFVGMGGGLVFVCIEGLARFWFPS